MQSPLSHIPEEELELVADFIHSEFKLYPSDETRIRAYRKSGHFVISDPNSDLIVDLILDALKERKPFSVLRIGDGEGNLMTYRKYPGTPRLDQYVAQEIINMQEDSFKASGLSLLLLRDMMNASTMQADILGVRGIWGAYRTKQEQRKRPLMNASLSSKRTSDGKIRIIQISSPYSSAL